MPPELTQLLQLIEENLNWGSSSSWQTRDFDKLQELIFERTGVSLSNSTLRRIWGRVSYDHMPSMATLDALALFAGFAGWREFTKTLAPLPQEATAIVEKRRKYRPAVVVVSTLVLAVLLVVAYLLWIKRAEPAPLNAFTLSARRVTDRIPNSVVFTYDASMATGDSVFIQQSWDTRRKTAVDKNLHTHTSVYYQPGFFTAKLFDGKRLVKEDTVMIPTGGWMGMINHFPVPFYLDRAAYYTENGLDLPLPLFEKLNPGHLPEVPFTHFANVGNSKRVPVKTFGFHAEIKNGYRKGAGICQTSYVDLLTDGKPIIIPISDLGCISELNLVAGGEVVSGKTTDLSGFGADMSKWVSVDCKSTGNGIDFFINGKKVYTAPLPKRELSILGFVFMFKGTGAVRNIKLLNGDETVFSDFNGPKRP